MYVCIYIYIYKSVLYVHGLQGGPMASYSQPFELYDVDVVDVVFTQLCHTSTNVIDFCFCVPSKTAGPQLQSRVPPIQTPRAPSSHIKSIISTSLHGRTLFSPEWALFQTQIHRYENQYLNPKCCLYTLEVAFTVS